MRRRAKPAKAKVEAKPPLAPKSSKNDGARIRDLEKRLSEALKRESEAQRQLQTCDRERVEAHEQQTATSEILRVISGSPQDAQPIFDVIVRSAVRLCQGLFGVVLRFDGTLLHLAAHYNLTPDALAAFHRTFPTPPSRNIVAGRAVLDRAIVHIPDVEADHDLSSPVYQAGLGYRSILAVPMLCNGQPLGSINVARLKQQPFTDKQIALVQTFADQAVIAIENVRLFTELQARNRDLTQALEQQTATSEILRIIASSPTNLKPVLDAIATNAALVCDAYDAVVFLQEGDRLRTAAHYGPITITLQHSTLSRGSVTEVAILDRQPVHVHDVLATEPPVFPLTAEAARRGGFRTVLSVPLLRENEAIGALAIRRREVQPFTAQQIELLQTFADQAVIAIENVRLFKELQTKNRELTTALDQQTVTSEILRAISSSLTNVQPVFNTIVESGLRLLGGYSATMMLLRDDDRLDLVAYTSTSDEADSSLVDAFPMPLRRLPPGERAIHERRAHAVEDVESAQDATDVMRETGRARGWRSNLFVPMIRDDVALGLISITRRESGPFAADQIALLEIFAAQAVIAIENVRLFTELQQKNEALTQAHARVSEALEQQTATAEILRVIASSPTDVQPVFDAIAESAARLTNALYGCTFLVVDHQLHLAALHLPGGENRDEFARAYPVPLDDRTLATRVARDGVIFNIADSETEPSLPEPQRERARRLGARALLIVPILRDGQTVGMITTGRREAGAFTGQQVVVLKTFADQAVIAIENVRLFTELQSSNRELRTALDQQTATAEILRVISSSPTAVEPVFQAIVQSGLRLLGGYSAILLLVRDDQFHLAAFTSTGPQGDESVVRLFPVSVEAEPLLQRTVRERRPVVVEDVETEPGFTGTMRQMIRARGWRSSLQMPMVRDTDVVGLVAITRREPGLFAAAEIALLETFAAQAVIAIENVRLFKELEARNYEVTEALEQQTATAEVLRAISNSATDTRPVFQTIVESAVRLSGALFGSVYRFDGQLIHLVAHHNYPASALEFSRRFFPAPPSRQSFTGRAILECAIVHVPDVSQDQERLLARDLAETIGFRSALAVPMLREGSPIGAITVWRADVGPFSDKHVALLQTFADQAVIAIQNEHLFRELQDRTAQLTRSVEQLTALGEVGRAVSSTLDLETVLTTIVSRAVELTALDGGVVFEYDEAAEEFVQRAQTETGGVLAEARRTNRIRKGEGVLGQTAITLDSVQVPDITMPGAYAGRLRENLIESDIRAILAVPMVYESRLIGCLGVTRNQPGDFSHETIELLRTFATQSALAIPNARLFHEIEDKSRQLETASQHKSEFLANMSHELRTPLNAIIGFSEVLGARMFGELNEKQEEYLRDIYASGQHLLSLINDILDLSKIEAGRMELELTDFNLPATLDNALTLVRERAGRRGIALGLTVDERLEQIRADERKLRQVVLNLLSNAIKFTPEGGSIEVRAVPGDGVVEVSVSDTGVGIATEDQEAIFEEFRQVGTASKKVEGTGLGLALSRKFVELHSGRIWVTSQVGAGSTFTFSLPVRHGE